MDTRFRVTVNNQPFAFCDSYKTAMMITRGLIMNNYKQMDRRMSLLPYDTPIDVLRRKYEYALRNQDFIGIWQNHPNGGWSQIS